MAVVEENIKRAIKSGDLEGLSADRLRELRVELNVGLGVDEYSCLHRACHYGKPEIVQHFLELGASVKTLTRQGWTAAHICAIRGSAICLEILCNFGINLLEKDKRGYTCAHLASVHGKCSVLQVLIKVGVDLTGVDRRGWSVVHHAAFHGRLGILQLLVKLPEVESDLEDLEGNTPAHLAAAEGQLESLRLLVYHKRQPADILISRNNNGSTPKDLAIQFHKKECVDFLILAESEVDELDYTGTGEFPAHAAAREGNLQLLSMLIKEGHCKINDQDKQGATPSHKAAGNGQTECLQWLLDHGADVTLVNSKGETPREVAIRFANTGCIALLALKSSLPPENWEGEETEMDQPSPISLERAKERVEKLQEMLQAARTRFRELGGELPEDSEIELLKREHQNCVDGLEEKLQFERERRETLEADMDQIRKQLQQATAQLQRYQSVSASSPFHQTTNGSPTPESTPDHGYGHKGGHRKKQKITRKTNPGGGAFIRIGPP